MTAVVATSAESSRAKDPGRRQIWAGRVISGLPVLMLLLSATMKLSHAPKFVAVAIDHFGLRESQITPIGILELAVTVLYVIPRTAFLGAILVTAYLGGAVLTHVRVGDPFHVPVVLGVLVWLGLYLRDQRLRALAPLRTL